MKHHLGDYWFCIASCGPCFFSLCRTGNYKGKISNQIWSLIQYKGDYISVFFCMHFPARYSQRSIWFAGSDSSFYVTGFPESGFCMVTQFWLSVSHRHHSPNGPCGLTLYPHWLVRVLAQCSYSVVRVLFKNTREMFRLLDNGGMDPYLSQAFVRGDREDGCATRGRAVLSVCKTERLFTHREIYSMTGSGDTRTTHRRPAL